MTKKIKNPDKIHFINNNRYLCIRAVKPTKEKSTTMIDLVTCKNCLQRLGLEINKNKKMIAEAYKPSKAMLFREHWLKKGYDLVDITGLCEARIGNSGWCNDINEPEENIYHVQILYRGETIANLTSAGLEVIDDESYVVFTDDKREGDFILFRLIPIKND